MSTVINEGVEMCCKAGGGTPIYSGTHNIRNGRNGGLESASREMGQANMDVGVSQETIFTDGTYTWGSAGYRVVATSVPSRHHDGVTLLYQDSPNVAVEAIRQFGVNVIACQLATGERR